MQGEFILGYRRPDGDFHLARLGDSGQDGKPVMIYHGF